MGALHVAAAIAIVSSIGTSVGAYEVGKRRPLRLAEQALVVVAIALAIVFCARASSSGARP